MPRIFGSCSLPPRCKHALWHLLSLVFVHSVRQEIGNLEAIGAGSTPAVRWHTDSALEGALLEDSTNTAAQDNCPWSKPMDQDDVLQCVNGDVVDDYNCTGRGGRAKCPRNQPLMCADLLCTNGDHCCEEDCSEHNGPRTCPDTRQPTSFDHSCAWSKPTDENGKTLCVSGHIVYDYNCSNYGGRAQCAPNSPVMCANIEEHCGEDHCCESDCSELGGPRPCQNTQFKRYLGNYCNHNTRAVLKHFNVLSPSDSAAEKARDDCEAFCLESAPCWGCSIHCNAHEACSWNAIPDCGERKFRSGTIHGDLTIKPRRALVRQITFKRYKGKRCSDNYKGILQEFVPISSWPSDAEWERDRCEEFCEKTKACWGCSVKSKRVSGGTHRHQWNAISDCGRLVDFEPKEQLAGLIDGDVAMKPTPPVVISAYFEQYEAYYCDDVNHEPLKTFVPLSSESIDLNYASDLCEAFCSKSAECTACSVTKRSSGLYWNAVKDCGHLKRLSGDLSGGLIVGDVSKKKDAEGDVSKKKDE